MATGKPSDPLVDRGDAERIDLPAAITVLGIDKEWARVRPDTPSRLKEGFVTLAEVVVAPRAKLPVETAPLPDTTIPAEMVQEPADRPEPDSGHDDEPFWGDGAGAEMKLAEGAALEGDGNPTAAAVYYCCVLDYYGGTPAAPKAKRRLDDLVERFGREIMPTRERRLANRPRVAVASSPDPEVRARALARRQRAAALRARQQMNNAIYEQQFAWMMMGGSYYGGGAYGPSHGGYYAGGVGSSHRGGHYVNPSTGNHYVHHK
jgi:hypothetical protein